MGISQEDQRGAVLWEGAEQGVELIEEAPQGTWGWVMRNRTECVPKTLVVLAAFTAARPGNNIMKWLGPKQQRFIISFCTFIQFTPQGLMVFSPKKMALTYHWQHCSQMEQLDVTHEDLGFAPWSYHIRIWPLPGWGEGLGRGLLRTKWPRASWNQVQELTESRPEEDVAPAILPLVDSPIPGPVCSLLGTFYPEFQADGDFIIGGVFPIHYGIETPEPNFTYKPAALQCWGFDLRSFRWAQTMRLAVEEINQSENLLPNFTLGYKIHDSCATPVTAQATVLAILNGPRPSSSTVCSAISDPLAVVGESGSAQSIVLSRTLQPFRIPMLAPFLKEYRDQNITGIQWIASDSWVTTSLFKGSEFYPFLGGTIGFAFRQGEVPGLSDYLMSVNPLRYPSNSLVHEMWGALYGCSLYPSSSSTQASSQLPPCTGLEPLQEQHSAYLNTSSLRFSYSVYKAVYAIAHSLHNLISCKPGKGPFHNSSCAVTRNIQPWQLQHYIQEVSFTISGEEVNFDANGDVAPSYDVINWQRGAAGNIEFVNVGRFDGAKESGKELIIQEEAIVWTGHQREASCTHESCAAGSRKAVRRGEPLCCFDCVPCDGGKVSNETDYWSNAARTECIPKFTVAVEIFAILASNGGWFQTDAVESKACLQSAVAGGQAESGSLLWELQRGDGAPSLQLISRHLPPAPSWDLPLVLRVLTLAWEQKTRRSLHQLYRFKSHIWKKLAEEHSPPLNTDMAAPAVGRSTGSCSTPGPREHQWKQVGDRGRRGRQRKFLHPLPSQELRLENRFTVVSPDSSPDRHPSTVPTPPSSLASTVPVLQPCEPAAVRATLLCPASRSPLPAPPLLNQPGFLPPSSPWPLPFPLIPCLIHSRQTRKGAGKLIHLLTPKKSTLVGTWNVRTMFQAGKAATITKEMVRYNLSVLGLGETRWTQSGEVKLASGQSIIYSGHEEDGANHMEGVAIMMTKETRKALIAWEPINSRLSTASFRTNNRRVKAHIIQCYAPTNDADDEVKARSYDSLNHLLGRIGARDLIILMGDFNAKIGGKNEGYEEVMGKHGVGKMNENGEMFVETCVNNNLVIGGSSRKDKREQVERLAQEAEEAAAQRNMKELYAITKKLAGKYTQSNKPIRDKNGQTLSTLEEQLERWVMKIQPKSSNPILMHGTPLEEVEAFTYLGSGMDTTGGTDAYIKSRINKARVVFNILRKIWSSKTISTKTKLRIFNSNVKQVLLSVCSESCAPGSRKAVHRGEPLCCFDCVPCDSGKISNKTDYWSNTARTEFIPKLMSAHLESSLSL
ncbi:hypothetical protein SKAU_G00077840 [Synaphobranchus kaupii]|uniref:Uncharacterized protein n=1 Tax=Synaphobranchus kaupii TaxID=118154 RepID=A0A9Q1J570_SYNKA|nr:hypothetical protein SKAU_G00077840 [Synaphobranchus kaupii]